MSRINIGWQRLIHLQICRFKKFWSCYVRVGQALRKERDASPKTVPAVACAHTVNAGRPKGPSWTCLVGWAPFSPIVSVVHGSKQESSSANTTTQTTRRHCNNTRSPCWPASREKFVSFLCIQSPVRELRPLWREVVLNRSHQQSIAGTRERQHLVERVY